MICRKCNKDFEEKLIDSHHVHPRFMDNKKGEGRKVYLCKSCHMKLHLYIGKFVWDFIPLAIRKKAIEKVINMSEKYGGLK